MLLTAEYNDYATEREPLRVTWPKGLQRSTYYLSLPYRYSIPLLVASTVLHWLVSQSIFYVEVILIDPNGVELPEETLVTCGYSPLAIIFAILLGLLMLLAAVLLGMRRFKSHMPLAGNCSAAVSAACHPVVDGDHALKPIMWGEIANRVYPINRNGGGGLANEDENGEGEGEELSASYGDYDDDDIQTEQFGYAHCSFTSEEVVYPSPDRLYA